MSQVEHPPFTCTHSANLPDILFKMNCTLAISTYQAGKVIMISAPDSHKLIQLPRTFQKPMGISHDNDRMAIATQTEVVVLNNARKMALNYPQQPNTYDSLFLPRASYYTGEIDIHDLYWTKDKLWAVNTRFSCLSIINEQFSFTPVWKPFFIETTTPDDQCHLNGVTFENDLPKYVTAFGKSGTGGGWRATKANGGIAMDVAANAIIAEGLQMPHSPRLYDGKLYVLESASGELTLIDPSSGKKEVVASFNGFARGMDRMGDFLFIGLSLLRKKSPTFSDLPIASKALSCGVAVFHLPSCKTVGYLKYENSVEEIYDVRVLGGMRRPNLLNHMKVENRLPLITPDHGYWAMQEENAEKKSTEIPQNKENIP
jgi:uncharacterized protein (TIGR03032 family)